MKQALPLRQAIASGMAADLAETDGKRILTLTVPAPVVNASCCEVTTKLLGMPRITEQPYENSDGTPIAFFEIILETAAQAIGLPSLCWLKGRYTAAYRLGNLIFLFPFSPFCEIMHSSCQKGFYNNVFSAACAAVQNTGIFTGNGYIGQDSEKNAIKNHFGLCFDHQIGGLRLSRQPNNMLSYRCADGSLLYYGFATAAHTPTEVSCIVYGFDPHFDRFYTEQSLATIKNKSIFDMMLDLLQNSKQES